jgi:hypothetical protein
MRCNVRSSWHRTARGVPGMKGHPAAPEFNAAATPAALTVERNPIAPAPPADFCPEREARKRQRLREMRSAGEPYGAGQYTPGFMGERKP